jgi:Acidobacterial duplicated orphan permease
MRRVFRLPFARAHIAREVDDELAFHLEMRMQRLVDAGWDPDRARQEALRQFGDIGPVRQNCVTMDEERERAMRRANVMAEFRQDLVYAFRALRRNVGFTAIIVCALAVGIGANTAIFTLIDAVLIRQLPVSHPEQLVTVGLPTRVNSLSQGTPRTDLLSYPLYRDLREHNQIFSGLLASSRTGRLDAHIDGTSGQIEHPRGRMVSGNYFSVLGVRAYRGRVFDGSEDRSTGTSPIVVISHGYWTRRFENDPAVIGRAILINNTKMTIVGVTPPDFTGEVVGSPADMWLPVSMYDVLHPNQQILNDRTTSFLLGLGRLAPGATLARAQEELPTLLRQTIVANAIGANGQTFLASAPKYYVSSGARGFSRVRDTFHAPLLTLMIGVVLLLCIICANVANLLLARSIARGREMAVRLAIGANRGRLVRQLLTESVVLAGLGAAMGLLVAWWGSRGLLVLSGAATSSLDLGMDLPVLGFTLVLSVMAVLLFGLVPALRASCVDLASTMRASAHSVAGSALGSRGQRAPLGKLLIAGQVALSVILLVGAGMLVHSLRNVQTTDVGLDRDHLLIADIDIRSRGYDAGHWASTVHAVHDRIAQVPGVAAVGYSENGIFSGTESATTIEIPGFVARTTNDTTVAYDQAGPNYVHAIGGHLLAGRDFSPSDEGNLARIALVNQSLAAFYFPNESAVGKFLHTQDSIAIEIVGVLADTRDHDLEGAPARRMYFPYVHHDAAIGVPGALRYEIRTERDPAALVQDVRRAILSVDPTLPIDDLRPLTALMQRSIAEERVLAQLATAFGALALLLAAIGLYGVMTYAITRRTGEIGLRIALGAQRANVVQMVLVDALRLVGIGLAVGLPLALLSTRLLRTQLHGIETVDPISIAAAIGVLALSAIIAVLIPAVRASRVSPIVALRAD